MITLKQGTTLLLLALLSLPTSALAVPASFDIDLRELDRQQPVPAPKTVRKKVQKVKKKPAAAAKPRSERSVAAAEDRGYLRYTVRPGDHIFKILIVRFGMSNEAAERLIPEVARVNRLANIRRLTIGETLLIPGQGRHERPARSAKSVRGQQRAEASRPAAPPDERIDAGAPQLATPPVSVTPRQVETPAVPVPVAPSVPAAVAPAEPVTESPPVAAAPSAAQPVHPSTPSVPPANTWICSVTEQDAASVVDAVLNALSVSWHKNRIVQSNAGAPDAFSIRVDRYFEYKGSRCIVSIGDSDPYSYTLLRILETAGYRVLRISGREEFRTVGENLLSLLGVVPYFGRHALQGENEATGFLVQQDDAGGRRVVITGEPADAGQKWVLAPGCGSLR